MDLELKYQLMHTKWCVRCFPDKDEPAEYIYHGNSLCRGCLDWMIKNNFGPGVWGNNGIAKEAA